MQLDISKCIANFLIKNDAVSIGDIGSFYLILDNDVFIHNDHGIHPPYKSIRFDQQASDDTQFVVFLANQLHVSIEKADRLLQTYVKNLKYKLKEKGSVQIFGIGKLFKRDSNHLEFKNLGQNFHKDYAFLPSLNFSPLETPIVLKSENVEPIDKIGRVSAIDTASAQISASAEAAEPSKSSTMENQPYQQNTYRYDEPEKGFIATLGAPFWILLLLFLLVAFGIFRSCGSMTQSPVDAAKEAVSETASTVGETVNGLIGDETNDFGKYGDILTQEIVDQGCVIIVGSFKRQRNALRMREKIMNRGYQPYSEFNNGLNRIGIQFECLDHDLVDFLQKIRKDIDPKAWYRIPGFEVAYE